MTHKMDDQDNPQSPAEINIWNEAHVAPLRPYRLLTDEAEQTLKGLAGIGRNRPDLFAILDDLSRSRPMFLCHLDLRATEIAGQNVLRYHPAGWLVMILAAYVRDDHWKAVAQPEFVRLCREQIPNWSDRTTSPDTPS